MLDREPIAVEDSLSVQPSAVGSDLKVSLTCPDCGSHGWVKWADLSNSLQCPKCQCKFLLNRSGKLQSLSDLPHVRYTCPRCRQSASVPTRLAVRAAECMTCKLPMLRGAEQVLNANGEGRPTPQAGLREAKSPVDSRWWEKFWMTSDGRFRKISIALAGSLFLGLLWFGSAALGWLFDNSPESRAREFTYACLADDQNRAPAYIPDDAVQRVELGRWRVRYFPSILDRHRPAGDTVRVAVESINDSPQARVMRVTMSSQFIGQRTHEQHWQRAGDRWCFDPVATLRTHDPSQ